MFTVVYKNGNFDFMYGFRDLVFYLLDNFPHMQLCTFLSICRWANVDDDYSSFSCKTFYITKE